MFSAGIDQPDASRRRRTGLSLAVIAALLLAPLTFFTSASANDGLEAGDPFITSDTTWRYLDDNTEPHGTDANVLAWTATDFDDSEWQSDAGTFGALRGAIGELSGGFVPNTLLNHYINGTSAPAIPAYFFRTQFEVDADEVDDIQLLEGSLIFDDAVRVYLNGELIYNDSDERATDTSTNLQYAGTSRAAPVTRSFTATADALVEGTNTVSVILYQDRASSSDIYLDFVSLVPLSGEAPEPAPVGDPERVILTPTHDPSTSQNVTWRVVDAPDVREGHVELRHPDGTVESFEAELKKELGFTASGTITTNEAQTVKRATTFTATLTGLVPSTRYAYRAVSGDGASDWYNFTTGSASDDPFTFTWYADGQNDLTEKWTPIVELTSRAFPNSELTLQSGDLIDYSVEHEWEEWFTITDGERQTENWAPAIGNHEYFSDAGSDYWDANYTFAANGPQVPEDADPALVPYYEIIAGHLKDRSYYFDYQGVRFIQLNSERRNQSSVQNHQGVTLPALPSAQWQELYLGVQRDWLIATLESSTANWNIVQFHHPTFSTASGRNNPEVRAAWLPVFEEYNVDLILSGHDHTYARGHLNSDVVEPGVTSGPVFAVSNSGPKYYNLAPDSTNVWLNNDATQVVKHAYVSITAGLRVTPTSIEYEAIVAQKGNGSTTDLDLGETVDSFTITRHGDGSKSVTEGIERRVATGLAGEPGEPVDGDIQIQATVPESDAGPNALTLTIENEGQILDLGEALNGGDRWSFSAVLPTLSVTDTRTEAAGWSLVGSATDLNGPGGLLGGGFLGWLPRVLDGATADSGDEVLGTLLGGEGLAEAALLASANDHSRWGTTQVTADLALDVPVGTQAGDYAGAIQVSLFPVD